MFSALFGTVMMLSVCFMSCAVGLVVSIVKRCAFRLVGNHIGYAWMHLVGVTFVYCGTMRILNASVGTLEGCVRQSLWTSVVELASRLLFKYREVALLNITVSRGSIIMTQLLHEYSV
jgi:hypothetical protein